MQRKSSVEWKTDYGETEYPFHPSQSRASCLWNSAFILKCLMLHHIPNPQCVAIFYKKFGNIGIIPAIVHKIVFPSCNGIPVKWVLGAVVDSWELLITINMFKIWKIRTAVEWFSASHVTKVRYFCTRKYLLTFYLDFVKKGSYFRLNYCLIDWLIEVYVR